jgi:hypothetical protein
LSYVEFVHFVQEVKTIFSAVYLFVILDCCSAGMAGSEIVNRIPNSIVIGAANEISPSLNTEPYYHPIPEGFTENPAFFRFSDSTLFFRQIVRFLDGHNFKSTKELFSQIVSCVPNSHHVLLDTHGLADNMELSVFFGNSDGSRVFPELEYRCKDEPEEETDVSKFVNALYGSATNSDSVSTRKAFKDVSIQSVEVIANNLLHSTKSLKEAFE